MRSRTCCTVVVLSVLIALVSNCAQHDDDPSVDSPNSSPGSPASSVPQGALLVKSDRPQDTMPAASDADIKALGASNRAFALALYSELAKTPGNLFFSPYSISTALVMAYAGARGNTAVEMQSALRFGADQARLHAAFNATGLALANRKNAVPPMSTGAGFELSIVNQAWGDRRTSVLPGYLDVLAQHYGAGLYLLDLVQDPNAGRLIINAWVAQQTQNRIKDLLPPDSIHARTRLVLTNAIYFKASWFSKFDSSMTRSDVFHAVAGDRQVPTMHKVLETSYTESADYQAVELPYLSPSVRMLIVLPAQGRFAAVEGQLGALFDQIRQKLTRYQVTLSMPKFSFDSAPGLKTPLQALGMRDAFTPNNADFSGITGGRDLVIEDVVHKAFVAVDETGTEAAAATAVIFVPVSLQILPQATVTLDRPFLFCIYDEPTGAILFLGRLSDPG